LGIFGVPDTEVDSFHFRDVSAPELVTRLQATVAAPFSARHRAHIDAIRWIAQQTELLPVGMPIGPFSLMTKLLADPITPVAMAGMGATATEDTGVRMVERCLQFSEVEVARSIRVQAEAGAKALLICEPAANAMYLSPKQIGAESDILERFVIAPNLRIKALLDAAGSISSSMIAASSRLSR
jgi:hypothetical protein